MFFIFLYFFSATFELQPVLSVWELNLPEVDFRNLPIIYDVTYENLRKKYAENAAEDVTQGRHVVNPEITACKLMNILSEAARYIDENHLEINATDWKHGQTLNRILHLLGYLDVRSIEHVFNAYQSASTPKDAAIK